MEAFGMYLLKSVIWLTGFTLIYFLFLRNERYFTLNRAFLVAGAFASLIFPLFTWHYAVIIHPQPVEEFINTEVTDQAYMAPIPEAPAIPFYWWMYMIGLTCLAFRLIFHTIRLVMRLRKTGYQKNGPVKLVRTPEYPASFSFLSYVFVNPSTSDTEIREILNHESGHIQSRHWLDLLLIEVVRILQWFNPFVWIYAHFIRQNHEYLADELALQRTTDPAIYRAALLNQVLGVPVFSLANSFSYSLNQKRFNMMKKRIQSPIRKLRLLLVLPLIATVFYAFAKPEYIETPANPTENISSIDKAGKVKGTVTDEKGNFLEGVTVAIKGTTIGTITDENGDFILKDVPPDGELAFSYVGMKSKILKPDFDKRMKVIMGNSTVAIEPVFVGEDPNKYQDKESSITNPGISKGDNQYVATEQMPEFPGGQKAMMKFLLENIKYPPSAKSSGKEGTVILKFNVSKRGKIKDVNVVSGVDPALNAEAVRVVSSMPDWNPGKQNGKAVEVACSIPVQFSLAGKPEKDNQPKILIRTLDGIAEPLFIIDGKQTSKSEFEKLQLDPSQIFSVSVLKKKSAIGLYGEKGANGVILIKTKKGLANSPATTLKTDVNGKEAEQLIVIDGKEIPNSEFAKMELDPSRVESVSVLKEKSAVAVFGEKGINEVILITTKKGLNSSEKSKRSVETNEKEPNEVRVVSFGKLSNSQDTSYRFKKEPPVKFADEDQTFTEVEQMPEYPGGQKEMMRFIQENIKYPPEVASLGIQGTVIVQFIVTKTGKLDNLKVVRGVHPLLDKEALRVLKMMPVWTPGKQGGKPVNVYYTLPFKFVLGKKEATNSTDEKPFASVEQMPEFPGGQEEMMNFITKNMNYPPEASAKKIQGTVITQFIVRKTGKLTNYKVVRGVNPLLDEEALRVLKLMPEWTPGKQGGKPVDVYYTLPFRFTLN